MLYYVEYLDVVEVSSLFPVKRNTLEALLGEVIFHSQRLVLSSIYKILIDLSIVSNRNKVVKVGVFDTGIPEHRLI